MHAKLNKLYTNNAQINIHYFNTLDLYWTLVVFAMCKGGLEVLCWDITLQWWDKWLRNQLTFHRVVWFIYTALRPYPCTPTWVRHLKQSDRTQLIYITKCHPRGVQCTDQVHPPKTDKCGKLLDISGTIVWTLYISNKTILLNFYDRQQCTIIDLKKKFILPSICFFEYPSRVWAQFTNLQKKKYTVRKDPWYWNNFTQISISTILKRRTQQ